MELNSKPKAKDPAPMDTWLETENQSPTGDDKEQREEPRKEARDLNTTEQGIKKHEAPVRVGAIKLFSQKESHEKGTNRVPGRVWKRQEQRRGREINQVKLTPQKRTMAAEGQERGEMEGGEAFQKKARTLSFDHMGVNPKDQGKEAMTEANGPEIAGETQSGKETTNERDTTKMVGGMEAPDKNQDRPAQ
ncbi:unnamed protein product [Linum trigynum]